MCRDWQGDSTQTHTRWLPASPAFGMLLLPPVLPAAAVANAATAPAAGAGGPRPASTEMLKERGPLPLAAPANGGSDVLRLKAGPASLAASIRQARMLSGTELSISMLSCRKDATVQGHEREYKQRVWCTHLKWPGP